MASIDCLEAATVGPIPANLEANFVAAPWAKPRLLAIEVFSSLIRSAACLPSS